MFLKKYIEKTCPLNGNYGRRPSAGVTLLRVSKEYTSAENNHGQGKHLASLGQNAPWGRVTTGHKKSKNAQKIG